MDVLGKIRRWHFRDGQSIREISKKTTLSRNTIRRYLRGEVVEPEYPARDSASKLDAYAPRLLQWLAQDAVLPSKQQRTGRRLYEGLKTQGYDGSYDRVSAFIRRWRRAGGELTRPVFIPLFFAPGEAFQFDWSSEYVELGGAVVKLKVAQVKLCYSRKAYLRAYFSEAHEMLFDAHLRAFAYFGGVPRRGIYDNMKTAVTTIGEGKARIFNRRFLGMASHYLFEPQACTPAAGWEKGRVERGVGSFRAWLFVPRLKFVTLAALNDWLEARCAELAHERPHPELQDRTIEALYQEELPALGRLPVPFDGYAERQCRVSSQALVHFERNRYSVPCAHVGETVSLRIYAERIRIVTEGQRLTEHARQFARYQTVYDPWHYLPALARKPGALRNGAPFTQWALPAPLKTIQARLMKRPGGDKQFVQILAAIPVDGFETVTVACEQALAAGVINADHVLNIIHRLKAPPAAAPVETPDGLQLKQEPAADVLRYDQLLKTELTALAILIVGPLMHHYPPVMLGVPHATA